MNGRSRSTQELVAEFVNSSRETTRLNAEIAELKAKVHTESTRREDILRDLARRLAAARPVVVKYPPGEVYVVMRHANGHVDLWKAGEVVGV